jgi:hypothetical protein
MLWPVAIDVSESCPGCGHRSPYAILFPAWPTTFRVLDPALSVTWGGCPGCGHEWLVSTVTHDARPKN